MFCKYCGAENDANAYKCTRCGNVIQMLPVPPVAQYVSVSTNLVWAILATLFCCLPTGIVAIVYAAQVDGKLAVGDVVGAQRSSSNAAIWSWVSFGLGFLMYFVWVIAAAAGA